MSFDEFRLPHPGIRSETNDCKENEMNEQTANTISDVLTIGVPVTDQDRALEFYLKKLRLEKRRDVPVPQFGGRWIEVAPHGATVTIALVPTREGVPTGVQTGIRLKTGDAGAVHADLRARGVDVGELLRWPGVPPMFELHDQDGNGLEIVQAA
jgi:lactoylglutathione lyase